MTPDTYGLSFSEKKSVFMSACVDQMKPFVQIVFDDDVTKQNASAIIERLFRLDFMRPGAIIRQLVPIAFGIGVSIGPKRISYFRECLAKWRVLPENKSLIPLGSETKDERLVRLFLERIIGDLTDTDHIEEIRSNLWYAKEIIGSARYQGEKMVKLFLG